MKEEDQKKIQEIMGEISCPKGFRCYESGFEGLCRAKDVGLDSYLECFEKNPQECTFSIFFGHTYYCRCPLRVYLIKHLKK